MADTPNIGKTEAGLASLAISAETTSALGTTLGLITQLKGVLYDIAQNPLLAPYAAIKLQNEIGKITVKIREFYQETDKANKFMSILSKTISSPTTWTTAGAFILSTAAKLLVLRTELEKTSLSFYKATGLAGAKGFALGLDVTKKSLDVQLKYGKETSDLYIKNFQDLNRRMEVERSRSGQKIGGTALIPLAQKDVDNFLTNISLLSQATGVDYAKASQVLLDSFSHMGMALPTAMAEVDLFREAWEKGNTAIGNVNDNMELSLEIMHELATKGATDAQAFAGQAGIQKIAKSFNLTTQAAKELFQSVSGLSQFGAGGVQERLTMWGRVQSAGGPNKRQRELLGQEKYKGMSVTAKLSKMALENPAEMEEFKMELIRQAMGKFAKPGAPGEFTNAYHEPGNQMRAAFAVGEETPRSVINAALWGTGAFPTGAPVTQAKEDIGARMLKMGGPIEQLSPTAAELAKTIEGTVTQLEKLETIIKKLGITAAGSASPQTLTTIEAVVGGIMGVGGVLMAKKAWTSFIKPVMDIVKGGGVGATTAVTGSKLLNQFGQPAGVVGKTLGTKAGLPLAMIGMLIDAGIDASNAYGISSKMKTLAAQPRTEENKREIRSTADEMKNQLLDKLISLVAVPLTIPKMIYVNLNLDGKQIQQVVVDTQNNSATTKSNP